MTSTLPSKLEITPILSETFAPPSTTPYGRSGFWVNFFNTSTSAATSVPATCGSNLGRSKTDACLRWTAPKPSPTYASASAANSLARTWRSASSLEVSAAEKRIFSSNKISPALSAVALEVTSLPVTAPANCTGAPSSSDKRFATGASESSGLASPFGRPRCAAITMLAPFARRVLIVGSEARMRPSSVISPFFNGTLRSQRRNTRLPATSKF